MARRRPAATRRWAAYRARVTQTHRAATQLVLATRDIIDTLSTAKGSIVHYRNASQSGVQVVSMQVGVTPIVSPVGALPEFQPPGCSPIGVDDIDGLATAFDELADPQTAAGLGTAAAQHYAQHYAVEHAAERLHSILTEVAAGARTDAVG